MIILKNLLKIITSLALVFTFLVGFSPATTSAAESQITPDLSVLEKAVIDIDMDSIDISQPYTETKQYKDEEGNPYTLEMKFTPSPITTFGSESNPASVGTWTSSFNGVVLQMSYQFDVSKSGTHWKISNARNHSYFGVFVTFSNAKLSISNSTSSSSSPAEVNASVDMKIFDNAWIPVGSSVGLMWTTISDGGTMTLNWN
jgi:hypothetical protein